MEREVTGHAQFNHLKFKFSLDGFMNNKLKIWVLS